MTHHIFTARRSTSGFSLIELMVSISIFAIVMTISMGTLMTLIDANAKAQALSSAMTNISFALDSMTRNIRTGRNFECTSGTSFTGSVLPAEDGAANNDCPTGDTAIIFTPGFATSTRMAYRLNGGRIEQWIDKKDKNGADIQDSWVPITSDTPPAAVTIDTLKFVLRGSQDTDGIPSSDYDQPNVSLLISGSVQNGLDQSTEFQVQSKVTQRVLNF